MYLNQKTKYACKPKAKWPNQKKKKKKLQRKDRERSAILEGEREKEREREMAEGERLWGRRRSCGRRSTPYGGH